eukprot:605349-Pelagomonas_calceolata.AAC.11
MMFLTSQIGESSSSHCQIPAGLSQSEARAFLSSHPSSPLLPAVFECMQRPGSADPGMSNVVAEVKLARQNIPHPDGKVGSDCLML